MSRNVIQERIMKKTFQKIICLIAFLCPLFSFASEIYMAPGDTRVIQVKDNVETVYISSPDVADYELISDKSLVAYAKNQGRADLIVFDKSGDQVLKMTIVVDTVLSDIAKKINQEFPDSTVNVLKMGKSYVVSGMVPTEQAKDRIYQIVGEGTGAERIEHKKAGMGQTTPWLNDAEYRNVVNKLELPVTNQVNVKLSVVEVSRTFVDNVGIDWGTNGGGGNGFAAGTFRFVKFNADTLTSLVRAIRNDSVARVLAEPNLSVLSGETADFLVGGEVPVVTSSQNGSNVDYKTFGIKLNVGARVNSNKNIRLTLSEEVSNVDETYKIGVDNNLPSFRTRSARTTIELADGESFLLGGLLSNNDKESLRKVPFIGDVPLLGALFRNASTSREKTDLVVVATVNLVKPITPREVVLPDFKRTSTLARFFNLDGITDRRDRKRAQQFIEDGGFIK
ncbi:secretin [[Pantoea] beijingensis]|uniref:Secretin n=2 Tax=[Pantoea] beijingensis TaxID=1324864 RepID=A0A443IGV7_9GAMM|nr:secretin [[Pantoea] beijingensis]